MGRFYECSVSDYFISTYTQCDYDDWSVLFVVSGDKKTADSRK